MTGSGWSVEAWRSWCQTHAATHGGDVAFRGPNEGFVRHLGTDTRSLSRPSETIFFALVGPWHDGHDFLQDAHDAGVRHWVVGRAPCEGASWTKDSDVLVVADVYNPTWGPCALLLNPTTMPTMRTLTPHLTLPLQV